MAGESGSVSRQFATKLAGQFRNINSPGRAFLADFRISSLWTLLVLRFSVKIEHAINPGSGERIAVIFRTHPVQNPVSMPFRQNKKRLPSGRQSPSGSGAKKTGRAYFSPIPALLLADEALNFAPGGGSGLAGSSGWPPPPQPTIKLARQNDKIILHITAVRLS